MTSENLDLLTATELRAMLSTGATSAERVVRACLERIEDREAQVAAWTFVDPALAIAQARRLDQMNRQGALHGIPIGFKDVFDTCDMPTEYNSPIYKNHRPVADSAVAALTRRAGGVVLGKTVTTEFAYRRAGPTRHPQDPSRTPGGSSSGSAAAVADGMVPLAFGTQTGGSTIRPAAYCGIVGYKPTLDMISRVGLKTLSESLDTVGLMARSVPDVALLLGAITGVTIPDVTVPLGPGPKIGYFRTPHWDAADSSARDALDTAAAMFARAGAKVNTVIEPDRFAELWPLHKVITEYEFARSLAYEFDNHRGLLSPALAEAIQRGWMISSVEYEDALRVTADVRLAIAAAFHDYDAFLTLSAPGEAPAGIDDTGSSLFNRAWTLLGLPCITLPVGSGPLGLPLGIQLIGPPWEDHKLLRYAHWAHRTVQNCD